MRVVAWVFAVFSFLFLVNPASALVEIQPESSTFSTWSDLDFTVDISISGVNNVYGFQFDLNYDDNILNLTGVYEGTHLNESGQHPTFCLDPDLSVPGTVDNYGCSRIGQGSVSGDGLLARVTFRLDSISTFPTISELVLSNVKISDINSIPLDSSFQNSNITIYECFPGEQKTCSGGTQTCGSDNRWGSCDTSGDGGGGGNGGGTFPPPPSDGDGDEDEQPPSGPTYYRGDLNKDGCVDVLDLTLVGANFGKDQGIDVRADPNEDYGVDILDLAIVGLDFGLGHTC